jgi:hypothetical protein
MRCPHCDQKHPEDALFCPLTGKKILIPMVCPGCGTAVDPNWLHCGNCGQKIILVEEKSIQQAEMTGGYSPAPIPMPGLLKTMSPDVPITNDDETNLNTSEEVPGNTTDEMSFETFITNEKKRHGCFTAWLVFMCVVYLIAIFYLLPKADVSTPPPLASIAGLVGGLVTLFALFKWKKWGFWLYCGLQLLACIYNLLQGISILQSLYGLIGIPILFGILQIGKEKKGWTQLE